MDQVPVNIQQYGTILFLIDDVGIHHLIIQGPRPLNYAWHIASLS